jgi:hypothetical protein
MNVKAKPQLELGPRGRPPRFFIADRLPRRPPARMGSEFKSQFLRVDFAPKDVVATARTKVTHERHAGQTSV